MVTRSRACNSFFLFLSSLLSTLVNTPFDTVLVEPQNIQKLVTISHAHLDPPQAELKALRLEAFSEILVDEMGFQDFAFFAKYKVGGDKSSCMQVDKNRK